MRTDIARLMAVTPTLPVKGLYDLLIEKNGDYSEARDTTFRYTL